MTSIEKNESIKSVGIDQNNGLDNLKFIFIITTLNAIVSFIYIFIAIYFEFTIGLLACLILVSVDALILLAIRKKSIGSDLLTNLTAMLHLFVLIPVCYYSGGATSPVNVWLITAITSIFMTGHYKAKYFWGLVIILTQMFNIFFYTQGYSFPNDIKPEQRELFNLLLISGSIIYIVMTHFLIEKWKNYLSQKLTDAETDNSGLMRLNQQYKDIQSMVKAGAWELNVKTEETIWSDQIYDIYKIPIGTPTNIINGLSYYAPHERVKLQGLITDCIMKRQSFNEVFEFYDSEGIKKWVRSAGRPVLNDKNEVHKVLGTFQDVTLQMIKEKELELVIANISEGYWDWYIKNDYQYMSPRFWEILGYDYRDKKHHPSEWKKLIHPEDLEKALTSFDLHFKTNGQHPFSLDLRYLHEKGHYHWIKCEGKVVDWDKQDGAIRMVGTYRDIHQEKAVTHEAQLIKEAIEDFTIVSRTDLSGKIIYANNFFCQISKYEKEELLGNDHRLLNSGHHPKKFFEEIWKTILSNKTWRGEIKNKAKDGSFYWVDTTIIPITSVNGEIIQFLSFRYDISKRKESEEKLAESNASLDLALEGANLGIWDWDLRDDSVKFDKRWASMLGLDVNEIKMELATWESRVHPDDIKKCYDDIKAYMNGETSEYENIHRMLHHDGHWVYILDRGRFSDKDADGKPIRFSGTHFDVTELKVAEKNNIELMEKYFHSNQRLEAILNFSPVMVFECEIDNKWTMNFVNSYAEQITGYSSDELINNTTKAYGDLVYPEDQEEVERTIQKAIRDKEKYSLYYRIIHKNGNLRWVWEQGAKSSLTNTLSGVIVDVTERKRREEIAMLVSHVRARFIELAADKNKFFEYLLEKILILTSSEYGFIGEILEDKNGKYLKTFALTDISWNEETKKFYQNNAPSGLEFKNLNTLFGEVIKTGELLIANDALSHPKAGGLPSGHPALNRFLGVPITYNSKIFAMVGVANNKNDYRLEDVKFLKPFFDLVGEMIQSLRLTTELELQKKISLHNSKLASIGELAAGVGHEINNPLSIIKGNLEMLSKDIDNGKMEPQVLSSKITKSLKGVDRIANIVKGLRSFARADEALFSNLNISELITDTKDMLFEIFEKENIKMNFEVETELWVNGNRGRLQQVFVNILNNAKDALASSDIKRIDFKAYKRDQNIEISISDTGPGIPDHLREKIFDPFFTTKEIHKGTGIGLALVSSIIKEHEGTITLKSEHHHGACFVITLQSQKQAQSQEHVQLQEQAQVQVKAKGRILVVDDEEDLRQILQDILESHGLAVVTKENGQEALNYLTNHYAEVDFIISDMKMPIINGPEFARAVKDFNKYKGGFFFITGGVNVSLNDFSDLVNGVLTKPFNEEEIIRIIKKWVKQ